MRTLKSCGQDQWDYAEFGVCSRFVKDKLSTLSPDVQQRLLLTSDENKQLFYYIEKYNRGTLSKLLSFDKFFNDRKSEFIVTNNSEVFTIYLELLYNTKTYEFELYSTQLSGMIEEHTTLTQLEELNKMLVYPTYFLDYIIVNALELYKFDSRLEKYKLNNINVSLNISETNNECSDIKIRNLITTNDGTLLYKPYTSPDLHYVKSTYPKNSIHSQ